MLIEQHDLFGAALYAKKTLGLKWRIDEIHDGSRGKLLMYAPHSVFGNDGVYMEVHNCKWEIGNFKAMHREITDKLYFSEIRGKEKSTWFAVMAAMKTLQNQQQTADVNGR